MLPLLFYLNEPVENEENFWRLLHSALKNFSMSEDFKLEVGFFSEPTIGIVWLNNSTLMNSLLNSSVLALSNNFTCQFQPIDNEISTIIEILSHDSIDLSKEWSSIQFYLGNDFRILGIWSNRVVIRCYNKESASQIFRLINSYIARSGMNSPIKAFQLPMKDLTPLKAKVLGTCSPEQLAMCFNSLTGELLKNHMRDSNSNSLPIVLSLFSPIISKGFPTHSLENGSPYIFVVSGSPRDSHNLQLLQSVDVLSDTSLIFEQSNPQLSSQFGQSNQTTSSLSSRPSFLRQSSNRKIYIFWDMLSCPLDFELPFMESMKQMSDVTIQIKKLIFSTFGIRDQSQAKSIEFQSVSFIPIEYLNKYRGLNDVITRNNYQLVSFPLRVKSEKSIISTLDSLVNSRDRNSQDAFCLLTSGLVADLIVTNISLRTSSPTILIYAEPMMPNNSNAKNSIINMIPFRELFNSVVPSNNYQAQGYNHGHHGYNNNYQSHHGHHQNNQHQHSQLHHGYHQNSHHNANPNYHNYSSFHAGNNTSSYQQQYPRRNPQFAQADPHSSLFGLANKPSSLSLHNSTSDHDLLGMKKGSLSSQSQSFYTTTSASSPHFLGSFAGSVGTATSTPTALSAINLSRNPSMFTMDDGLFDFQSSNRLNNSSLSLNNLDHSTSFTSSLQSMNTKPFNILSDEVENQYIDLSSFHMANYFEKLFFWGQEYYKANPLLANCNYLFYEDITEYDHAVDSICKVSFERYQELQTYQLVLSSRSKLMLSLRSKNIQLMINDIQSLVHTQILSSSWSLNHMKAIQEFELFLEKQDQSYTMANFQVSNTNQMISVEIYSLNIQSMNQILNFLLSLQPLEDIWRLPSKQINNILQYLTDSQLQYYRTKFGCYLEIDKLASSSILNNDNLPPPPPGLSPPSRAPVNNDLGLELDNSPFSNNGSSLSEILVWGFNDFIDKCYESLNIICSSTLISSINLSASNNKDYSQFNNSMSMEAPFQSLNKLSSSASVNTLSSLASGSSMNRDLFSQDRLSQFSTNNSLQTRKDLLPVPTVNMMNPSMAMPTNPSIKKLHRGTYSFADREAGIFFYAFEKQFRDYLEKAFHVLIDDDDNTIEFRPSKHNQHLGADYQDMHEYLIHNATSKNIVLKISFYGNNMKNVTAARTYLEQLNTVNLSRKQIFFPQVSIKKYKEIYNKKTLQMSTLSNIRLKDATMAITDGNSISLTNNNLLIDPLQSKGFINIRMKPPMHCQGIKRMLLPADVTVTICGSIHATGNMDLIQEFEQAFITMNNDYLYASINIPYNHPMKRQLTIKNLREDIIRQYGLVSLKWEEGCRATGSVGTAKIWSLSQEPLDALLTEINALAVKETDESQGHHYDGDHHSGNGSDGHSSDADRSSPTYEDEHGHNQSLNASVTPVIESKSIIKLLDLTLRYVLLAAPLNQQLNDLLNKFHSQGIRTKYPYRDRNDLHAALLLEGETSLVNQATKEANSLIYKATNELKSIAIVLTEEQYRLLISNELSIVKYIQGQCGVHLKLEGIHIKLDLHTMQTTNTITQCQYIGNIHDLLSLFDMRSVIKMGNNNNSLNYNNNFLGTKDSSIRSPSMSNNFGNSFSNSLMNNPSFDLNSTLGLLPSTFSSSSQDQQASLFLNVVNPYQQKPLEIYFYPQQITDLSTVLSKAGIVILLITKDEIGKNEIFSEEDKCKLINGEYVIVNHPSIFSVQLFYILVTSPNEQVLLTKEQWYDHILHLYMKCISIVRDLGLSSLAISTPYDILLPEHNLIEGEVFSLDHLRQVIVEVVMTFTKLTRVVKSLNQFYCLDVSNIFEINQTNNFSLLSPSINIGESLKLLESEQDHTDVTVTTTATTNTLVNTTTVSDVVVNCIPTSVSHEGVETSSAVSNVTSSTSNNVDPIDPGHNEPMIQAVLSIIESTKHSSSPTNGNSKQSFGYHQNPNESLMNSNPTQAKILIIYSNVPLPISMILHHSQVFSSPSTSLNTGLDSPMSMGNSFGLSPNSSHSMGMMGSKSLNNNSHPSFYPSGQNGNYSTNHSNNNSLNPSSRGWKVFVMKGLLTGLLSGIDLVKNLSQLPAACAAANATPYVSTVPTNNNTNNNGLNHSFLQKSL